MQRESCRLWLDAARCRRAGPRTRSFHFGQFGTPPKAEIVDSLIADGIDRIVFSLPPADADVVLPKLDSLAEFAAQYG